jgi:uncharacterized membrane protein YvlD (DUF360 family)
VKLRLIRIGLSLLGNALGLLIAATVLDDMEIEVGPFIFAVVIFSVLSFILTPAIEKAGEKSVDGLQSLSALISTAIALWLTDLLSDGLSIAGIGTFLIATILVWLGTVVIGVVLARFVLRRFIEG